MNKARTLLYLSIFSVFFIADFLEYYLKSINYWEVYASIKPVLISLGITFSVNKFLKEISKKEAHDELEKQFRANLLLASDSVRTSINEYIISLKTLLKRSIKDTNVTKSQLIDDRKIVFSDVKSLESKWKKILKLLQGEE